MHKPISPIKSIASVSWPFVKPSCRRLCRPSWEILICFPRPGVVGVVGVVYISPWASMRTIDVERPVAGSTSISAPKAERLLSLHRSSAACSWS